MHRGLGARESGDRIAHFLPKREVISCHIEPSATTPWPGYGHSPSKGWPTSSARSQASRITTRTSRHTHATQPPQVFAPATLRRACLANGIGLLGFTALFIYLASRGTPGVSVAAFVTTVLGIITIVAVIGVAAFAQPAIGKAFLAGQHDVIDVNSSVYDTTQNITSGVGIVLWVVGGSCSQSPSHDHSHCPRRPGFFSLCRSRFSRSEASWAICWRK